MKANMHAYPTVYALGHGAISNLLDGPVVVEEKIDGSQFSILRSCLCEMHCRSKGKDQSPGQTDKMFKLAVEEATELNLMIGWTYRFEYLAKPKHNTLCYDRVPRHHLILFDVDMGEEQYLPPIAKHIEAARIDVECVPVLYEGQIADMEAIKHLLETQSILGGTTVEGIVIKNYACFTREKKVACGKYVSEKFKETHDVEWRKNNPQTGDIIHDLVLELRTEARWEKALQHLRDAGTLENSLRDIGALYKEVPADVRKECEDEIKVRLFAFAWPRIHRAVTAGLAEWYKERLGAQAFADHVLSECEDTGTL